MATPGVAPAPTRPAVTRPAPVLVEEREEVVEPGDPLQAHIVKVAPGESATAKVLEARIYERRWRRCADTCGCRRVTPSSSRCARSASRSTSCTGSSTTACPTPDRVTSPFCRRAARAHLRTRSSTPRLALDPGRSGAPGAVRVPDGDGESHARRGQEAGEAIVATLRRELHEELGLPDVELGPPRLGAPAHRPVRRRPVGRPARPALPRPHASSSNRRRP